MATAKRATTKKSKKRKTTPNSNGTTAEYYVASELSRRGYLASMTIKNAPGIDIVAVNPNTEKMYFIQVKSKQQLTKTKKWALKEKDEQKRGANFFYVFVNLNIKKEKQPDIYIVSSAIVAKRIKENQKEALAKGRKNTSMREFIFQENEEKSFHIDKKMPNIIFP